METVQLRKWKSSDKKQLQSYRDEFFEEGKTDSIEGATGLAESKTMEEWFQMLENNEHEETLPEGFVPATTYVLERSTDKKIVGIINIRHRLNDFLLNYGGHIGYSVRKSERNKGYAKEMLQQALEICKELELYEVLITCHKSNVGSRHTIRANKGILENEISDGEDMMQRFWITLL